MKTNRDVICQLDEAFKVLSGPSHSIYKVAKVADILREIRAELDGCKPCKPDPCKPCEPGPDCCDDDDCYEDCDDEGYVWIYVPKDYQVTLTPCE